MLQRNPLSTTALRRKSNMEVFGFTIPTTPILLVVLLMVLGYVYLTWNFGFWEKRGIPGPKPYPLVGTMMDVFKKGLIEVDVENVRKYGKVIGEYFGGQPSLLICDADMIKQILVKEFHNFPDKGNGNRIIYEGEKYMSKMITNLQGDEWKRVRNTITPAFSASKLKVMIEHVNHNCDTLMKNFLTSEDAEIDVKKFTDAFTLDVIARVGFGVELDSQKDPKNPFLVNGRKIFEFKFSWRRPLLIVLFLLPSLYTFLKKTFPEEITIFPKEAFTFFINLIRNIMKQRENGGGKENLDLIQLMLNAHNLEEKPEEVDKEIGGTADKPVSKKGLTEEEVVAQSFILMIGGFETTSSTISYFLYNMMANQKCQEKLQKEIDEVVGDSEIITYDMAHKLPYLDMCINESLRLYPTSARTDRNCSRECTINGITIPKDMSVTIGIGALHYDQEVWPEPHQYDPERFTPEARAGRDPIYFMPFSAGPRNCIGMRLAQLEIRIAAIKILQKFTLRPCDKTQIPLKICPGGGILKPEKPIVIKLESRK